MAPDPKVVKQNVGIVFQYKQGEMVSMLLHVADRLAIFASMADGQFVTTNELAERLGLHRRWLMELLRGLTAAKILVYEEGSDETERFGLTTEMAEVLENERDSVAYLGGFFVGGIMSPKFSDALVAAFHTGIGISYRERSLDQPRLLLQTKRMLGPWTRTALVPIVIAAMKGGGIKKKLQQGGAVLDMGCGAGIGVCAIAEAFPNSIIHGVDPDDSAIVEARNDASRKGLKNARFFPVPGEDFDEGVQYDFAVCLDIVHDCPFPDKVLASIFRHLKPGGTLLIKDIKSTGSFPMNLKKIPSLATLYGFSVSSCLSSAMSVPGGMGLGTLGFNPAVAKGMCTDAGFIAFTQHDFKDPANLYYEMEKPGGIPALTTSPVTAIDLSLIPGPSYCKCHSHLFTMRGKL